MKKTYTGFFIGVAAFCVLLIVFLASGFWKDFLYPKEDESVTTRIITPTEAGFSADSGQAVQRQRDNLSTRVALENGEVVIAVINKESEEGRAEEQFAAYSNASDPERGVYLTYIVFDTQSGRYRRVWNAPTAAARTETISLSIQDMVGDRNSCVIVTGMSLRNEHTMTIFRRSPGQPRDEVFRKIAELQIDGSIVIQEAGRSLAYQQGIASGQSFNIVAYSHDNASDNILDQIETTYSYNPSSGRYEQSRITRIPGSQVEQRRLRELLSGRPGVFEAFINDLWYHVGSQAVIDSRQYIYFDPSGREIIFFGDEAQQVFYWHSSTPTRYGLYIRSQNISISTLLRFIDIELESLDRIRLRVIEDVHLPITVSTTWDGSYRRGGTIDNYEPVSKILPAADAVYDSSWGRIHFLNTGEYTISLGGTVRKGSYVFYKVSENLLLELRAADGEGSRSDNRMVYRIDSGAAAVLSLSRVRVGNNGIQDMPEPPVILTPAN